MNGIIDSISNLLMPLCSVWIVNKFVNNSFEKKESKKIFTRIIWGLFILIQIVMETEKGNVSIQKGIISFFVILGIIMYYPFFKMYEKSVLAEEEKVAEVDKELEELDLDF